MSDETHAIGIPLPDVSPDELRRICQLLYLRTGMVFGEPRRFFIERRMADRMRKTGAATVAAYLGIIASRAAEMEAFINAFTNNETYFYREDNQLATLGQAILPAVVANRRPGDLVRIWSVPCSSGEEPYSIAIWLLENWRMVDSWHIEIVGSDIDTDILARAQQGRYGERALARLPDDVREAYFGPRTGHVREIIDDLKESIVYSQVNLIDPASVATEPPFDVIFCRNVLIYFDDSARQIAAANLFNSLNPGGFLVLGQTESLSRIDARFQLVRFGDTIVYRRP